MTNNHAETHGSIPDLLEEPQHSLATTHSLHSPTNSRDRWVRTVTPEQLPRPSFRLPLSPSPVWRDGRPAAPVARLAPTPLLAPPQDVTAGWNLDNLTFAHRYVPREMISLEGIQQADLSVTLRRTEECLRRLSIQAEYADNPVNAKLRAREGTELQVMFFEEPNHTFSMSVVRRRGDSVDAAKYRQLIVKAALGFEVPAQEEFQSPNARDMLIYEGFLEQCARNRFAPAREMEPFALGALANTLTGIYNALHVAHWPGVGGGLLRMHHREAMDVDTPPIAYRQPLRFPPPSDARRMGEIRVLDASGTNPRAVDCYLLSADLSAAYEPLSFPEAELVTFGSTPARIRFCKKLLRSRATRSFCFESGTDNEVVSILELPRGMSGRERLGEFMASQEAALVDFMTMRTLECVQILEDINRFYFVFRTHSFCNLANTAPLPPGLEPRAYEASPRKHKELFRALVLATDAALQAGYCPTGLEAPDWRYKAPVHPILQTRSEACCWALGAVLYEGLTGLEFPRRNKSYAFWVARSGYFDTDIPDAAIQVLDRNTVKFDRGIENFFESIRAVHRLPSDAKSLLKGLLQEDPRMRLSIEQILVHPWLR